MHLFDVAHGVYGGHAIVGSGLPLAVGLALADAMQHRDRVTACFFGEGAMAEGAFHESLNLAALWSLPVLFVCENNLYAMGTRLSHEHSQQDLALRASSYGLASWSVDGMDVRAVADAATRAVTAIRGGAGPHFLECRTYRFRAHSMYDAERYRDKDEVAAWKERDPLPALLAELRADGVVDDAWAARVEAEVAAAVDEAIAFADASPLEPLEDLERHLLAEVTP